MGGPCTSEKKCCLCYRSAVQGGTLDVGGQLYGLDGRCQDSSFDRCTSSVVPVWMLQDEAGRARPPMNGLHRHMGGPGGEPDAQARRPSDINSGVTAAVGMPTAMRATQPIAA